MAATSRANIKVASGLHKSCIELPRQKSPVLSKSRRRRQRERQQTKCLMSRKRFVCFESLYVSLQDSAWNESVVRIFMLQWLMFRQCHYIFMIGVLKRSTAPVVTLKGTKQSNFFARRRPVVAVVIAKTLDLLERSQPRFFLVFWRGL